MYQYYRSFALFKLVFLFKEKKYNICNICWVCVPTKVTVRNGMYLSNFSSHLGVRPNHLHICPSYLRPKWQKKIPWAHKCTFTAREYPPHGIKFLYRFYDLSMKHLQVLWRPTAACCRLFHEKKPSLKPFPIFIIRVYQSLIVFSCIDRFCLTNSSSLYLNLDQNRNIYVRYKC